MATKIYAFGDAIRIELDGKPPIDQPKNTLRVTITPQTLPKKDIINISLASAESTSIGQYIDSKAFDEIQDSSGTPYSLVSATAVQDALNAFFFLGSGGAQFDLTNVFDFTNSYLNDFDVNASGDIIAYPQALDTARRGIFFLPFVKSVEWTYNTRVANWAILGGLKALYTGISTFYSVPRAADFASGIASTVVMPAPLQNFSAVTRFKLTFNELSDAKYRLYGKIAGVFQLLYTAFDATTTELLPLSGFHANNQLGISIDGVGTVAGIAMGNVFINNLPISSFL